MIGSDSSHDMNPYSTVSSLHNKPALQTFLRPGLCACHAAGASFKARLAWQMFDSSVSYMNSPTSTPLPDGICPQTEFLSQAVNMFLELEQREPSAEALGILCRMFCWIQNSTVTMEWDALMSSGLLPRVTGLVRSKLRPT